MISKNANNTQYTFSSATAQTIYISLIKKYNKSAISKIEFANEVGLGLSTVSKMMADGYGLPNYKKIGNAKNSRVVFPLINVAEFLADTVEVA
jgi:predicted DNA-binding transcriptional regulator AlpA